MAFEDRSVVRKAWEVWSVSQHTEAVVSDRYRRFAETEAKGRSALYYTLAQRIADDAQVIGFLLTLPMEKT